MTTETGTMTLTEFLTARLNEDETAARDAVYWGEATPRSVTTRAFMLRFDPARVLAEVAAKRCIVERCSSVDYAMPSTHMAHGILRELASVYADHPDYRQEWV